MITYGETIRGMQNVSPLLTYKFSNLDSQDMAEKYFLDFYKVNNKGLEIIVADEAKIDPSDISEFKSEFTYPDTGKFAFTLKVFISTDGLKIREAYEVTNPAEYEVLFFIEENKDDWSKQVLFAKIGEKVRTNLYDFTHLSQNDDALKYINTLLSSESKISFDILKELCENGYIEEKTTVDYIILKGLGNVLTVFSAPAKAVGWVVEKAGEAIDLLKIPDRFWDDENENYVFSKESILNSLTIDTGGFLNRVLHADTSAIGYVIDIYGKANFEKQIGLFTTPISGTATAYNAFVTRMVEDVSAGLEDNPEITDRVKQDFALLAGLWNGLVDFISSTLKFIGTLVQSGFDIVNNWQEFLEIIDNLTESLSNINPSEIWEGIKILYEQVKTYFKDADGLNWVRIAYIVGYAIAFVGTMFIPIAGWVGKIAKVDKLIPDELLGVLKKSGEMLTNQLSAKSRNANLLILRQCAELLEIFTKGRQAIKEFFTKLGDDIGKWFVSNKRKFESLVAKAKNIFTKNSKTDELFRDISKKFIVKNHGNLSKTKFLKIAKQIEKHFGTKLHWVDRNSYEFKELYKKWYDSPIYAVFHSSTFKNGRYGITLEGPAIYFFEGVHKFGGTIKLTTYTLQHELIHVKLWYKMTKEFPELSPLYKKIPRWLDEANVIAEFLQQNAQKIGKWEMDDILNDLNKLNENLNYYPSWKKSAKEILGKEQLELKDFENWNLSKFLEKL